MVMNLETGIKIVKAVKEALFEVIMVELPNGKYKILSLRMSDEKPTISDTIEDFLAASYIFDTKLKELWGN